MFVTLTSCTGQMLADGRATASITGILGVAPADVSTVSRTADGPNNADFLVEARGIAGRRACAITTATHGPCG